jgi:ligand-binding SRPBCC domain-containing protein
MYYQLTDRFVVQADLARAWEFFGNAENLPRITPPSLGFKIAATDTPAIREGTILDYTIRWVGIPIRWRTKIIDWTPPRQFIDLQIRGPYALWHHQHAFRERAEGTECSDLVIYKLPVPGVGRVMHALLVKKQLLEIFRFRRGVIGKELGWLRAIQKDVEIETL